MMGSGERSHAENSWQRQHRKAHLGCWEGPHTSGKTIPTFLSKCKTFFQNALIICYNVKMTRVSVLPHCCLYLCFPFYEWAAWLTANTVCITHWSVDGQRQHWDQWGGGGRGGARGRQRKQGANPLHPLNTGRSTAGPRDTEAHLPHRGTHSVVHYFERVYLCLCVSVHVLYACMHECGSCLLQSVTLTVKLQLALLKTNSVFVT